MRFVPSKDASLPVDLVQALNSELKKIQTSDDPQFPSFTSFASAILEQERNQAPYGKQNQKLAQKSQAVGAEDIMAQEDLSDAQKDCDDPTSPNPFPAISSPNGWTHDDLPKSNSRMRGQRNLDCQVQQTKIGKQAKLLDRLNNKDRLSNTDTFSELDNQNAASVLRLYTDGEESREEDLNENRKLNDDSNGLPRYSRMDAPTDDSLLNANGCCTQTTDKPNIKSPYFMQSGFTESEYSPAALPSQRQPSPIPVEIRGPNDIPVIVGHIVYYPMDDLWSNLHALARQAAVALADMVAELLETRYQLWRREAELATKSVGPLVRKQDQQLAFAFQDILRSGAECLKCQAAAMYLLDDDTSSLKMRSCWGLPAERLQDSPRSLVTAMADLEAMVGHVVVLEDTRALEQWQAPEDFPSAFCVPLISDSNILGTIWFFSQKRRTFSDAQTKVAEITAGRLAVELERAALQDKASESPDWKKDVKETSVLQKNQLPVAAPWMVGWDLSAAVYHSRQIGGNFYDWFSLANGQALVALGDCQQKGMTGAIVSEAVKTALRCHASHLAKVDALMEQVDRTIWSCSAADQYANLFTAIVQPDEDIVRYTTAGNTRLLHITARGWEDLTVKTPLLGQTAQATYDCRKREIAPNEILLVLSNGVGKKYQTDGKPLNWNEFLRCAKDNLPRSAKAIARELKGYLEVQCPYPSQTDYSLLVIKRKN